MIPPLDEPATADDVEPLDTATPTPTEVTVESVPARPRRVPILPIAIVLVLLLAGSALFMSGYSMGRQAGAEPGTPVGENEAFRPFWDTYQTITDRYAGGKVDREALIQGAIKGMIGALDDPYSSYLTSAQYRQSLESIGGEFEGIGAEIGTRAKDGGQACATLGPDCHLVIIAPIAGSPAESAGLRAGDLVLAVDGVSLDGLTVDGARDRIRGPKGSVVTLSVERGGAAPIALSIKRDVIQSKAVESRDLAGGTIGYVALTTFSDRGAEEFRSALKAHIDAGRTRIVVDLRGNPGGLVTAARSVASQFIGSGPIFWEQTADGTQTPTDAVPGGVATDPAITVICLVDGGSASASEIVAGALQDAGRARLVGQATFGKGTVQQWQELTGEGGAFRLTVARWLTPDKHWVHGVGLQPDVVVPAAATPAVAPAGTDPVLDRAVELLGERAPTGSLDAIAA